MLLFLGLTLVCYLVYAVVVGVNILSPLELVGMGLDDFKLKHAVGCM